MDDLTHWIARRRRQDRWFGLLGLACTLLVIAALGLLLLRLITDTLALADNAPKALAIQSLQLQPATGPRPARLLLELDDHTLDLALAPQQWAVLRDHLEKPVQCQLRGRHLRLSWPAVHEPLVLLPLDAEQFRALTADDNSLGRLAHALGLFFTSFPSGQPSKAGILSAWVGTLCVLLVTAVLAIPLGVGAGIYLEEYASKNWLTTLLEINISNLAGVPSILYGLLALGVLVYSLQMGRGILTGGITLAFLILPIIIVATREALRTVPKSIREAAYALGATRWQVVRHHLLPYSAPGIWTGILLGLSRALGETAPLLTIGALTFLAFLPPAPVQSEFPFVSGDWLFSPFTTLPIQLYNWLSRPNPAFRAHAAAAGLVLLLVTVILHALALWMLRFRKRP